MPHLKRGATIQRRQLLTSENRCPILPDFPIFPDNLEIHCWCVFTGVFNLATNKTFLLVKIELGAISCGPRARNLDHPKFAFILNFLGLSLGRISLFSIQGVPSTKLRLGPQNLCKVKAATASPVMYPSPLRAPHLSVFSCHLSSSRTSIHSLPSHDLKVVQFSLLVEVPGPQKSYYTSFGLSLKLP